MYLNYPQIKMLLYFAEAAFGILLGWLAAQGIYSTNAAEAAAAVVLMIVSAMLLMFAILTYFLREDPDIWR